MSHLLKFQILKHQNCYRAFFLLVILNLFACNGADKLTYPSDSLPQEITLGQLSEGSSLVTIPLSVIEVEVAAVESVVIDIYTNDVLSIENISGLEYYHETYEAIRFSINGIEGGETIRMEIDTGTGEILTFTGTISTTEETVAE